jgi:hypothetical protein
VISAAENLSKFQKTKFWEGKRQPTIWCVAQVNSALNNDLNLNQNMVHPL